jgi:hypothetical protein
VVIDITEGRGVQQRDKNSGVVAQVHQILTGLGIKLTPRGSRFEVEFPPSFL